MPPRELIERTRVFALAVLTFCRRLPPTDEAREAGRQLRRAANSVRSNYRAARKGRSRAEFEAKLGLVWEEADECVDWLEYLRDGGIRHDPPLLQEAQEIARIRKSRQDLANQYLQYEIDWRQTHPWTEGGRITAGCRGGPTCLLAYLPTYFPLSTFHF